MRGEYYSSYIRIKGWMLKIGKIQKIEENRY